jgi:hypothetical protein
VSVPGTIISGGSAQSATGYDAGHAGGGAGAASESVYD